MPAEACGTTVYHRHVGRNAHFVDVSACIYIVKCIEDDVKALEKVNIELRIFDVREVGFDVDVRVELARRLFCNL